jgi:hypothetical protein
MFDQPDVKPLYTRGEDYWWVSRDKLEALQDAGALR